MGEANLPENTHIFKYKFGLTVNWTSCAFNCLCKLREGEFYAQCHEDYSVPDDEEVLCGCSGMVTEELPNC